MAIVLDYPSAVAKPLPVAASILSPARIEHGLSEGSLGYVAQGQGGYGSLGNAADGTPIPVPFVARVVGEFQEWYTTTDPATNQTVRYLNPKTSPFVVLLTKADLDALMSLQAGPGATSILQRAQEQGTLVAGSTPAAGV